MVVIRGKNDKNINVILIGKRDDLIYKRNGKIRGGCWIRISLSKIYNRTWKKKIENN